MLLISICCLVVFAVSAVASDILLVVTDDEPERYPLLGGALGVAVLVSLVGTVLAFGAHCLWTP